MELLSELLVRASQGGIAVKKQHLEERKPRAAYPVRAQNKRSPPLGEIWRGLSFLTMTH